MKTIFCGPPHSGKSVLVNNLTWLLPSDSYQVIRANGDGEGLWSNNYDQTDVQAARKKGTNNPEDFARWQRQIEIASQDIVIADIGGRIDVDKIPLFETCDSFVVLSSDADKAVQWKEFGEAHGCTCIALLDSVLEGQDQIYEDESILKARITNLNRGENISQSPVLRALAERIISRSGYKPRKVINLMDVCERLELCKKWITTDGTEIRHLRVPETKAVELADALTQLHEPLGHRYQILNTPNNFVAALIASTLWNVEKDDLLFYDDWTNQFIAPVQFRIRSGIPMQELYFHIVEEDERILLHAETASGIVNTEHFAEYIFPKLDTHKQLFISGRFPIWFVASIIKSYPNQEKYLYQPGKGYFCVESAEKSQLGNRSDNFMTK